MKTAYDFIMLAFFGFLVTLFLHRSQEETPKDKLVHYFPPAIACAVINYLGNNGYQIAAIVGMAGLLVYIWLVLKPLPN